MQRDLETRNDFKSWELGRVQASFHNHAQNVRVRYQSEAELLWRTTWRMPVVGLFLDPKRRWKSRRTSRIYENLAQQKFPECHFLRFSTDNHFFHTVRHVYRSVWPAREAKPRFGAALARSAHDCETSCWTGVSITLCNAGIRYYNRCEKLSSTFRHCCSNLFRNGYVACIYTA